MEYIESRPEKGSQAIILKGEWTVGNAARIEEALKAVKGKNAPIDGIDAGKIERLDTAGAWLIREYFPDVKEANFSKRHQALMDFLARKKPEKKEEREPLLPLVIRLFAGLGEKAENYAVFVYALFSFMGDVFLRMAKNMTQPSRFRIASITRHIYETGVQALPIIGLLAFGISMVISYQGAVQLRKFGADIYTIDLTVISLLREMGVLTTAIMFAGRTGSAIAAEIGVMKMRGEVDALKIMGIDPIETLVVPRLLALMVTLPVLTFFADIVGLLGGGFMAVMQLDISLAQYIDRVRDIATPMMFFIGMVKAPVFALLIAAICAYQGMNARGSAENVGKLTTLAVVQSIFLVIMADAVFSIVFSEVGI